MRHNWTHFANRQNKTCIFTWWITQCILYQIFCLPSLPSLLILFCPFILQTQQVIIFEWRPETIHRDHRLQDWLERVRLIQPRWPMQTVWTDSKPTHVWMCYTAWSGVWDLQAGWMIYTAVAILQLDELKGAEVVPTQLDESILSVDTVSRHKLGRHKWSNSTVWEWESVNMRLSITGVSDDRWVTWKMFLVVFYLNLP